MSFTRILIAAIAAFGLATAVFAADENTTNTQSTTDTQATQPADTQASAASATDNSQAVQTADENKVDVNKATVKELMKVKGINSSKAKAIVAYRKAHGDFKSLDELKDVKGFKKISDKAMKKLQDQLTTG